MYLIVTTPDRPPNKCICCSGDKDRDWWVDLGEDISSTHEDILPTVYVCNLCFTAIAKEKDIVDQGPLLEEIEGLKTKLFDAKVVSEALEQGLDGLFRARFINPDLPAAGELVSFVETVKSGEVDEQGEGEGVDPGKGETPEPSNVEDVGAVRPVFAIHGDTGLR